MKVVWYLHEDNMESEMEENLANRIGDHPDIQDIVRQIKNFTYEVKLNFEWDDVEKKLIFINVGV